MCIVALAAPIECLHSFGTIKHRLVVSLGTPLVFFLFFFSVTSSQKYSRGVQLESRYGECNTVPPNVPFMAFGLPVPWKVYQDGAMLVGDGRAGLGHEGRQKTGEGVWWEERTFQASRPHYNRLMCVGERKKPAGWESAGLCRLGLLYGP